MLVFSLSFLFFVFCSFFMTSKTPSQQYSSSTIERSIQLKKMQISKDGLLLLKPLLLMLTLFFTSVAQDAPTSFCGKIQIQYPFLNNSNSTESSLLHRMIQCKSQKLYFRTSVGLFPVSSINYTRKFLTITHRHCSSSEHYVSPLLLSAGFPPPPPPMLNSLLLFNCSNKAHPFSPVIRNCTRLPASCGSSSKVQKLEQKPGVPHSSCLLVHDLEKLGVGFSPKDFNCSHYSHLHRSLSGENYEEYHELGTRISFDIPDHVPNPCNECEKPNGNCGVGLRCICHPNECKDKVISMGGSLDTFGIVLFSLISLVVVIVSTQ
ncbi:hypothetical protein I3843_13G123600 [Carya illinoinensis]|uniref:Uncharacterized protein n=1 Tax=Carya illinoinensis TaxID=32201 RepID=A0A8T1NR85_CARIL|nr:uncharacterized protein LOC122292685 [Carya illinoinensis]KAG2674494.1 hypothetical protein I3760_13G139100 [Carya illinoinensis]KAG6632171.1 hypothetical protein CIPAW_13G140400 [Carya illinoinensis]KAG6682388.1 hypothetical protein I3842_13G138600 [Carya illinoinensis]KAG7950611.1 hypothetical protein I3843_13G123600 [Carya illinoinensis]